MASLFFAENTEQSLWKGSLASYWDYKNQASENEREHYLKEVSLGYIIF